MNDEIRETIIGIIDKHGDNVYDILKIIDQIEEKYGIVERGGNYVVLKRKRLTDYGDTVEEKLKAIIQIENEHDVSGFSIQGSELLKEKCGEQWVYGDSVFLDIYTRHMILCEETGKSPKECEEIFEKGLVYFPTKNITVEVIQ